MYVCVRTRACVCACTCACVCTHTGTHALCGWVDCSAWEKSIGLGVRSQPLARPGSSPGWATYESCNYGKAIFLLPAPCL